jgi:hypothetical protein
MRTALIAIALAGLACGKQTFLAAAFVQTPALPNPTDPNKPFPQYQIMTAYFGTIDTTDPTKIDASKLAPVKDAAASVSFHHKSTGPGDAEEDRYICSTGSPGCTNPTTGWVITSGSTGAAYILNSSSEKRLTFEQNTPYTLVLNTCARSAANGGCDSYEGGEAYGARLTPGPAADMQEFAAASATCSFQPPIGNPIVTKRCIQAGLGKAAMTITRTDAPVNGARLPAMVLVARIDPNNPNAEPQITFKTIPADAPSLLKYVLSDIPYRWVSYNIPESAFPQAGYYLVSILTVNTGKVSENSFLGSTALAAAGAAGIVIVQ